MRVRVISILVCLSLLLSFTPLLVLPPGSVQASQVLNLTYTATSFQEGNIRTIPMESGDEIVQFIRPNIVLGTNPYCQLDMVDRSSGSISGDLNGTATIEWQTLYATWAGLSPAGQGYMVGTATISVGSDTMVGCFAADADFSRSAGVTHIEGAARMLFHTCTDGEVMIGTGHASGKYEEGVGITNQSATFTLRRYSASEVSGPVPFTVSGSISPLFDRGLPPSSGDAPTDELVQFLPPQHTISIATDDPGVYHGGVTTISLDWTLPVAEADALNIIGTNNGGLSVQTDRLSDALGSVKLISLADAGEGKGYFIGVMEDATGQYRTDRYATYDVSEVNSVVTGTGNMYTMTPAGGIPTATGTGIATLVPDSGSIQNLTAVSEASMPSDGKPDIQFPHGFFEFRIEGLANGESVTLTLVLPSAVPTTASYWKYGPTPSDPLNSQWYQIPMGDNDGDNIITITLTDGGLGDDICGPGTADGIIVDQGGPGWPGPSGGGGHSAPAFPSVYVGIAAAMGAGIVAYAIRRRLAAR